MTSEICLSCITRHLEHNKIKIDMAESEEAFEGVFEFSVLETSKDLSQNGKHISFWVQWVLTFKGKGLTYFGNMYRAIWCSLLCCQLVDLAELSSTVRSFLSRYHGNHIFVHLWRVFRHSRQPLLRESYICKGTSVSSINLIELMYLHFPNFVS